MRGPTAGSVPSAMAAVAPVAAAALLAHATVLAGGFVWLDHAHLVDGLALAPPSQWTELFTQGFAGTGYYRPLMALALSVDRALGGWGWLYHFTSWLWHAGAAVMVVLAGQSLGLPTRAARLAGFIFAVHPLTSLVAGAIAFRSEAMVTVALLALLVFHRQRRAGAAALSLLGGSLCKETALVVGPLLIVALELEDRHGAAAAGGARATPRRRLPLLAMESAAWLLALALRLAFAPQWRAEHIPLAATEAVATRMGALTRSGLAVLLPVDRSICDASPVLGGWSLPALVGVLIALALAWVAWRRRGPGLLLALSLLPALQLVPVMRWWSPHYLYLPLAFAAMLLAEQVERLPGQARTAFAAVLVLAGLTSLHDGRRFRSDQALWTAEVGRRPTCREGQFFLAEEHRRQGRLAAAAHHYRLAIAETSGWLSYLDRAAALQNLGVTELSRGELASATTAFSAALTVERDPLSRRRLAHNLAATELRAGRAAQAEALLRDEVARHDAAPQSVLLRAHALHQLGRTAEAGALVRRLQALNAARPAALSPAP